MKTRSNSQLGSALITSLAVVIGLSALAGTYLTASYTGYELSTCEQDSVRARIAADEGLHRAATELRTEIDADKNGLGNIDFTGDDGRRIQVTATDLGGGLFRLHSVGTLPRASMGTDMMVEIVPPENLAVPVRAAITADGDVATTGDIEIDGRDWDFLGGALTDPGVFGISTRGLIVNKGSSSVGGNGIAPKKPGAPGSQEEKALWADGVDQDGDGAIDEESLNGLDDDGDGLVDEDTGGYYQNPDALFGLHPGTLMEIAKSRGTYFASQAELDSWIASNGGNVPGGAVVYCDFNEWLPVDFGPELNDPPSIIVHSSINGNATMKNVHGALRGMIICNRVQHLNGDFFLLGCLISLADEAYGNAFGNGSALVRYSSAALGELPRKNGLNKVTVVSWNRSSTN
jgi:hypothetical protein